MSKLMSKGLNELFHRQVHNLREVIKPSGQSLDRLVRPDKKRLPIVITLALIFLLSGCANDVVATDQPLLTPTPTATALPPYYEIPPTPERTFKTTVLQLGGRLELTTTEGQPADGKGVVVIEVANWLQSDLAWQINVESNMTSGIQLGCTFGDFLGFYCRGNLGAQGEIWPNSDYITNLNNKGVILEGLMNGVKVTYDDRWRLEK